MVKKARAEAEAAKISIRSIRRTAMDDAKKLEKDGTPEDDVKILERDIQEITNKHIEKVDRVLEVKEKDIMTV